MVKTGSSRLLGFYFLGASVVLLYAFLFAMTFFYFLSSLLSFFSSTSFILSDEFYKVAESFILSFRLVITAVIVALPFALSVGILILKNHGFYRIKRLKSFLILIDRSPLLLFGLVFFIIFGRGNMTLLLILTFIACSKLSRRWVQQSKKVNPIELEALCSLGMDFYEIFKTLYLKRFLFVYIGHVLSVCGFLLTAVTPVIHFLSFEEEAVNFFSLSLFLRLGESSGVLAPMIFVLFMIYILKFFFDSKVDFIEVEHG